RCSLRKAMPVSSAPRATVSSPARAVPGGSARETFPSREDVLASKLPPTVRGQTTRTSPSVTSQAGASAARLGPAPRGRRPKTNALARLRPGASDPPPRSTPRTPALGSGGDGQYVARELRLVARQGGGSRAAQDLAARRVQGPVARADVVLVD